jgi:hypothetical protein
VATITIATHSFTPFSAWSEMFSDDLAAVATVDRLFRHYVLIPLKSDSDRWGNTAGSTHPPALLSARICI